MTINSDDPPMFATTLNHDYRSRPACSTSTSAGRRPGACGGRRVVRAGGVKARIGAEIEPRGRTPRCRGGGGGGGGGKKKKKKGTRGAASEMYSAPQPLTGLGLGAHPDGAPDASVVEVGAACRERGRGGRPRAGFEPATNGSRNLVALSVAPRGPAAASIPAGSGTCDDPAAWTAGSSHVPGPQACAGLILNRTNFLAPCRTPAGSVVRRLVEQSLALGHDASARAPGRRRWSPSASCRGSGRPRAAGRRPRAGAPA